jgi:hypothetical protein
MSGLRTLRISPDGGLRSTRRPRNRRLLPGLLLASILGACGGGDGVVGGPVSADAAGSAAPAASSPPTASAWVGHFVGTVRVADQSLFGDALLTTDGSVRLYVGGPYTESGALQTTVPVRSEQLVANLIVSEDHARAAGTGVIIGQQCASAAHSRFCGAPASAYI